jgi:protein tyrosine phosphatase (PTP) superfamily phosphohydrolase (DUF442 family)
MGCSFDVWGGCVQLGTMLYVTGQPNQDAYQQIAAAGVQWVVCVRNPSETQAPQPPPSPPGFDDQEASTLLGDGVLFVDLPVTHGESQEQFDNAATAAAVTMLGVLRQGPALIHCSTGDRASAVVAVALIATGVLSNIEAEAFAVHKLLLRKDEIKTYVLRYSTPPWFQELLGSGKLDAKALRLE